MPDLSGVISTTDDAVHHRLSVRGRLRALDLAIDLDFAAPWTVFFGPSGCGKTTLLRAMAGLAGEVRVSFSRRGARQTSWTALEDATHSLAPERRQLAYAPQHAVLFPHLNVLENVGFAGSVRGGAAKLDSVTQQALALFDLSPLAHRRPRELSGGERQRVSLARAVAVPGARLVLLDEPFAGLDRALRDTYLPRLQTLFADRGIPVVSVTHDVDEVFLLSAHVVRLSEGHVVAQGTPSEVLADEAARVRRALHAMEP